MWPATCSDCELLWYVGNCCFYLCLFWWDACTDDCERTYLWWYMILVWDLVCILCIFPSVWWVADHADRSYTNTFLFKPWPLDHNSSTEEICMKSVWLQVVVRTDEISLNSAISACGAVWWQSLQLLWPGQELRQIEWPHLKLQKIQESSKRLFILPSHWFAAGVCQMYFQWQTPWTLYHFIIISDGPRWDMPQLELRRDVRSFAMPKSMPWATSVQLLLTMEKAQWTPKKMAGFPSVFWSDNGEIGGVGPGNCQQISADHGWE